MYRQVSAACAPAKSAPAASVKKTEKGCRRSGLGAATPAAVSASWPSRRSWACASRSRRHGVGQPQRGEPGGDRQRVARQRARLVHGPGRGQLLHHLGPAAEGRRRQPAAHHLAEGNRSASTGVEPVPPGGDDAETGHHLVKISSAPCAAVTPQPGVEPRSSGGDDAHVAGRRLGDHAGDVGAALGEAASTAARSL